MSVPTAHSAGVSLTRRAFVGDGAKLLAVGATGALLTGATALCGCSDSEDDELEVLEVGENEVVTLDAFKEYQSLSRHCDIDEVAAYSCGMQLHGSGANVAAALCQAESADPLNTVALVGLNTGRRITVLDEAVGRDDGYTLYDVFASDELLVWVESNFLTSEWSVYCASVNIDNLSIGDAVQLDAGDADWDAPEIAAIDETAYWIVQPAEDGQMTSEDSQLKASAAGSAASVLHISHGRFNGGLSTSGEVLTVMPRADTSSGVHYQLTAFQTGTGAIIASQVMPHSFRPSCAVYMNGAFSFSIGASYDYGGGIANVGTYYPLDDGTWLRMARTPVVAPGLCGDWMYCKSGSRTALINLEKRAYLTVDAPDGAQDYGDYPVAVGENSRIFVYATVSDAEDSEESRSVVLRCITPT